MTSSAVAWDRRGGWMVIIAAVLAGVLAAGSAGRAEGAAPEGWRVAETYSREEFKPFQEKYNFAAVQKMVEKIRAEGHPMPTGHPRVFINKTNKEALRKKVAAHHKDIMQMAAKIADANFGKTLTQLGGHSAEPAAQPVVLACAVIYQLGRIDGVTYAHTPAEYGADGVRHLMGLLKGHYEHIEYLGLPLGYDWLYDLMTDEQRRTVAKQLLDNAETDRTRTAHIVTWNNPPGPRLLGAMVVAGDGIDDERAAAGVAKFHGGWVFGEPTKVGLPGHGASEQVNITAMHIWCPEGPGAEGAGYAHWYNPFYPFLEAWYDQTGEDYFKLPFFQNWVFHYTHISGNEYEHHDKWAARDRNPWDMGAGAVNVELEMSLARTNRTAAALAKYHWLHARNYIRAAVRIVYMLRSDPTVEAKSPAELSLPTTAHFRVVNSVFGRNSWKGTGTAWVWFQGPTWNSVRDLGPVNDIMIWKHGGFLLCKRAQSHDYDGGNRTNTFVLYDARQPGQTIIPLNCMDRSANRGLGLARGAPMTAVSKDLVGYSDGLRYFDERPGEYLYCLGDGARSFPAPRRTEKDKTPPPGPLTNWSRQFVWFRTDDNAKADHFVVLDRIAKSGGQITEHQLFNFNLLPQIRDRKTDKLLGEGAMKVKGIWVYEDADRIVATNTVKTPWGTAHGRAFIDTLLPRDRVYYRMGGVTERNIDLFGKLHPENLPVKGSPDDLRNQLAGMWRVQITGKVNANPQVYLNTIQATDAKVESPEPTALIEGEGLVGARTGGNVALFSPVEAVVTKASVDVPAGTERVLICDLKPRAVYVVGDGEENAPRTASAVGTIFLKVKREAEWKLELKAE